MLPDRKVVLALGAAPFAAFYVAACAATGAAHLIYTRHVAPRLAPGGFGRARDTPSVGASGAVLATMSAASL